MDVSGGASGTTVTKRGHDATLDAEGKKEPDAAATDEPPAKTTPLRRPLLRPRPNISTERKTAETPPLPP
ncbi:hypothetical protein MTO96_043915 [Rhipicephalus appendiculatus]